MAEEVHVTASQADAARMIVKRDSAGPVPGRMLAKLPSRARQPWCARWTCGERAIKG